MRVVLQRVTGATVDVGGQAVARIGRGLVLLVGIAKGDTLSDVEAAVAKIVSLRVFEDETGKMNRSVQDLSGEILLVSQFTLLSDVRKGRRPSFTRAAEPKSASALIEAMVEGFRKESVAISTGVFGARMMLDLINEGPVTLVLDVANGSVS